MAIDVKVTINQAKPVLSSGFGFPLIFEGKATTAIPYTECSGIDEIIKCIGGITADDDESTVESKTETAKTTNLYKAAALMLSQSNAPKTIAICATTAAATTGLASILYHGWRQLVVVSLGTTGEDTMKTISEYIETTEDKMYFTSVTAVSKLAGEGAIAKRDRTVIMCHDDINTDIEFPEAALVGASAGKPAGSITYKNLILKGITPKVLTDAQINAIHAAHAMAFVLKSGDGVTSEGKATSDEYIDIIDSIDYIVQNIEYRTQKILNSYDKVPYTNAGISVLENACVSVLQDAANNGIIALDDNGVADYSVSYKKRSETKEVDRAARRYVEGSFRFALAGAIHTVEVVGEIEI